MKKFLTALAFLIISCASSAETIWFKTRELAVASVNNGYYTWSNWEKCVMNGYIDTDNDIVKIYSDKTQTYAILYKVKEVNNSSESVVTYKIMDQDYDKGELRLRIQKNNNSKQIYIDFADIAWCYNIIIL